METEKITELTPPFGGWVITHCNCTEPPSALVRAIGCIGFYCPACERGTLELLTGEKDGK